MIFSSTTATSSWFHKRKVTFVLKGGDTPWRNSFSCLDNWKSSIENKRHEAFKRTIIACFLCFNTISHHISIQLCGKMHLSSQTCWTVSLSTLTTRSFELPGSVPLHQVQPHTVHLKYHDPHHLF